MSFFKCFFTLGLTQYNIASYNCYVGIIKNLQFVVSNAFSIVLSPQYNLQWSHLRVDFCLFHVIYYIWLLNYHFTKTHALCDACSSSYKTTLHLQQVVCWCLNLNASLYWEIRANGSCFQDRVSSYYYARADCPEVVIMWVPFEIQKDKILHFWQSQFFRFCHVGVYHQIIL